MYVGDGFGRRQTGLLWWANTRLEENGTRKGMKNGAAFSVAWHRRRRFIESETRRPSWWGVTVRAGWQIAFSALGGKRSGWDNGNEIKVCENRQNAVTGTASSRWNILQNTTKTQSRKCQCIGCRHFSPHIPEHIVFEKLYRSVSIFFFWHETSRLGTSGKKLTTPSLKTSINWFCRRVRTGLTRSGWDINCLLLIPSSPRLLIRGDLSVELIGSLKPTQTAEVTRCSD